MVKDSVEEKINLKEMAISNLKLNLESVKSELLRVQSRDTWGRDKWVDDSVIGSYFSAMADSANSEDILFLGPSVTAVIKLSTPGMVAECLQQTSFQKSKYVFLCISNVNDVSDDSGSHWSLLFLDKLKGKAYHFDSLSPVNSSSAHVVASNLGINRDGVVEMACIQQKQSFECGIHVLANAKYIAYHYCLNSSLSDQSFTEWFAGQEKYDRTSVPSNSCYELSKCTPAASNIINSNNKPDKWRKARRKSKALKVKRISSTGIITRNRFEVLDKVSGESNGAYCGSSSGTQPTQTITRQQTPSKKEKDKDKQKYKSLLNYPSKVSKEGKRRVLIGSDSQGRDLSSYLDQASSSELNILNNCLPGAPLEPIMRSVTNCAVLERLSTNDCVLVMGGTNDVTKNTAANPKQFLSSFTEFLNKQQQLFRHTNLILATIPYRYDLCSESPENQLIKEANLIIRQLTYNFTHIELLELYTLQRCYHTRHGLHINRRGKKFICKEVIKIVDVLFNNLQTTSSILNQSSLIPSRVEKSVSKTVLESNVDPKPLQDDNFINTIQVVEDDMVDIINHFKNHKTVAFSHCISADFQDQRHMSGGVAVVFRKEFGRPNCSDLVSSNLSLQHSDLGAAVYGLVTKEHYHSKPSEDDYNRAFHALTSDLKIKKFKKLICSPMGCMRDKITPKLFSKNIVHLHRSAGIPIDIIVWEERVTRTLRNGLKHHEFVALLRACIAHELSLGDDQSLPASAAGQGEQRELQPTSGRDDVLATGSEGSGSYVEETDTVHSSIQSNSATDATNLTPNKTYSSKATHVIGLNSQHTLLNQIT